MTENTIDSEPDSDDEAMEYMHGLPSPEKRLWIELPPGMPRRSGAWTPEETALFLTRLQEVRGNADIEPNDWGIFALGIPGRVGYQCKQHYQDLASRGELPQPPQTPPPEPAPPGPLAPFPVPLYQMPIPPPPTLPDFEIAGTTPTRAIFQAAPIVHSNNPFDRHGLFTEEPDDDLYEVIDREDAEDAEVISRLMARPPPPAHDLDAPSIVPVPPAPFIIPVPPARSIVPVPPAPFIIAVPPAPAIVPAPPAPFILPVPERARALPRPVKLARLTEEEKISIICWHDAGQSYQAIADQLNRSEAGCRQFHEKWEKTHHLRGTWGRPTTTRGRPTDTVVQLTLANRRSTVIQVGTQAGISRETARLIRHRMGYHYYMCIPVPRLTEHARQTRVAFAEWEANNPDTRLIIFTDESMVAQDLNMGGIWRLRGEILEEGTYEQDHHPISVMIWGAVGVGFRGPLVRCPPSVNQYTYRQMLLNCGVLHDLVRRYGQWGFRWQQDNAPPHQPIREQLSRVYSVLRWPPYSPDLSPIEQVWAYIKRRLKGRRFANADELFAAISQEGQAIPQDMIDRFCSSFRARCRVCANHRGQSLNRHWPEVHAIHHPAQTA
jgi:transposase